MTKSTKSTKSAKPVSKSAAKPAPTSLDRKAAAANKLLRAAATKVEQQEVLRQLQAQVVAANTKAKFRSGQTTEALGTHDAVKPAAAKAPKAKRVALVDTVVVDHGNGHLTRKPKASAPKASNGSLAARVESYILVVAKAHTEAYANSLRRPLTAFVEWCASKRITEPMHLNTLAVEKYRAHAAGLGHAISTTRMSLARVKTFLSVLDVAGVDLSSLRIQHTVEEKEARAETAHIDSED